VASAASTLSLQGDILDSCACSDNVFLQTYLLLWLSRFGDIPKILPSKQPFWDHPGILEKKSLVESTLTTIHQQASFLAAQRPLHTVVTGFWPCPWHHVGLGLTTKQFELQQV